MEETRYFTPEEWSEFRNYYRKVMVACSNIIPYKEIRQLQLTIRQAVNQGLYARNTHGINTLLHIMHTTLLLCEKIGAERDMVIASIIHPIVTCGHLSEAEAVKLYGDDTMKIIRGIGKSHELDDKRGAISNEYFKNLLLVFADDIRVVFIIIINNLSLMRMINNHPDEHFRRQVTNEVMALYAPLAHKLGLYKIKSELEDLALKYSDRENYNLIAKGLNDKKEYRDQYIAAFIRPVKEALEKAGLRFEIKGRPKSIYSIWNKMKKQQIDISGIFDLFAIRIILDSEGKSVKEEHNDCWKAFSIVTNMYPHENKRMRDWLSAPKSNGYESLHATVKGPEDKWVEVQIRTHRMDEIAERGLAAHWRYKGIKSEGNIDSLMNSVRSILESDNNDSLEKIKDFQMDIYDKEVFVFSPKGDLYKFPYGSTVLDFAFHIHTKLGCTCIGAKVNGSNRTIKYVLSSGDTIEILTSSTQRPKKEWLNIAHSAKARVKIKQALNEIEYKSAELGKELLSRRVKNRKIELDDALLMQLIRKMGYKTVTAFYLALGNEKLDVNDAIEQYLALVEKAHQEENEQRSADEYKFDNTTQELRNTDELVIGGDIKGVDYRLARCCNPIFGDNIFGFISSEGTIRIHRTDCPNAANMHERYPYRIINARWAGKMGTKYVVTLRVVGHDDIGIVTNISSIIGKEKNVFLRSISIDSNDGLFQGHLSVAIDDIAALNALIKKLKTIKGIKDVQRGAI
ncbi:MAG: bifunctional (p)ppGpp synthetase/guanosine-3',5'-bis(diphosphate) 3'-pyrophosphohydrolase [Bacteroidaceae bacterium]|nr:bifunctional (p)ppGpp synthetase/guanosine-3',5'-bis(diphosphate) 3'-pyrophosphohydrolase [Bacteroidaceae bacterium]